MIRAGETIENPVTGERVTFLKTSAETDGELVLIETTVAPDGSVAAEHLHPYQCERFEILEGEVEFKVGGRLLTAGPGDVVVVEPGTAHRFRNAGEEEVRFRCEVRPALTFESFLVTMFGLAADGKTGKGGLPNPFHLAVIMAEHFDLVRLPHVPAWVQRAGLALGAPVGRLLGYEPFYLPRRGPERQDLAA
ncbi:cupin [Rubrobacter xylanophilus]|uniref:Cupin n=1 Tax=Rubrobacter xylanophilus TaxID=49319 RepID=A0A510HEE9_9ACTN|nr:cupin domain-containing protein [Rubrobacter xylanophilus]BBL78306.1 cupin [Rubrobacter xylanophilus]